MEEKLISDKVYAKHTLCHILIQQKLPISKQSFFFSTSWPLTPYPLSPNRTKSSFTFLCLKMLLAIIYICKIKYLFWVCLSLHVFVWWTPIITFWTGSFLVRPVSFTWISANLPPFHAAVCLQSISCCLTTFFQIIS